MACFFQSQSVTGQTRQTCPSEDRSIIMDDVQPRCVTWSVSLRAISSLCVFLYMWQWKKHLLKQQGHILLAVVISSVKAGQTLNIPSCQFGFWTACAQQSPSILRTNMAKT